VQDLVSQFKSLVDLHCVVDKTVHYQQMCGSSKVGWREMLEYLNSDKQFSQHFTGTSADKANWAYFQNTG